MPVHIRAQRGEIAEDVVMSGDPERVRQLSSLLDSSRLVNAHRSYVTYTGKYRGHPVTLVAHGIGGPSISIVFEELRELGARRFVRFGTTGALLEDMEIGDAVVATGASYSPGGVMHEISDGLIISPSPDLELTYRLYKALKDGGVRTFLGQVFSKNAFYTLENALEVYKKYGIVSLEMECSTLLSLSQMSGVSAACVLMVSDSVVKKTKMYTADELKEFALRIGRIVLDVLSSS
ncbi:MAG: nucleoside phosphorylase [Nitrososphaeria archaeon]